MQDKFRIRREPLHYYHTKSMNYYIWRVSSQSRQVWLQFDTWQQAVDFLVEWFAIGRK